MNFYRNEKPGDGSSAIGGGGGGGGGGGWINWFNGDRPDESDWSGGTASLKEAPGWYYSRILRKNGPWLLLNEAELLSGTTPCKEVPLLVTIKGKDHAECLRLEVPGRALEVLSRDNENIYARFDFSTPGEIKVYAKWQAGHYDYEEIHSAEFKILGKSYGVKKIPLGKKMLVATVEVV